MKEITLYAAARKGQVTGIFTTPEAACRCRDATVTPIRAPQLPGSPEMQGWVAAARGVCTTMSMSPQGVVQSQILQTGPCWGVNLQTAIAGLFAPGGDLRWGCIPRNVELTSLHLYRLDLDYGKPPEAGMHLDVCVERCVSELRLHGALSTGTLAEDFIAFHIQDMQYRRELRQRLDTLLPERLAEHLLSVACARAPGKRGFCGTYLSRVARGLDVRIARRFTLRELQILGAILKLQENPLIDPAAIPQEERAELLARLEQETPQVRRTTGLRRDDEDPAEIARSILHPEAMAIGGEESDVPEN